MEDDAHQPDKLNTAGSRRHFEGKKRDKILYKHNAIVLPQLYQTEFFFRSHDQMGHQGIKKVYQRILKRFEWPGMKKACGKWVTACLSSQQGVFLVQLNLSGGQSTTMFFARLFCYIIHAAVMPSSLMVQETKAPTAQFSEWTSHRRNFHESSDPLPPDSSIRIADLNRIAKVTNSGNSKAQNGITEAEIEVDFNQDATHKFPNKCITNMHPASNGNSTTTASSISSNMFFDDRLSQMQNNSHGDSNDAHESVSEDGYRLEYIAEVLDSNDFVDVSDNIIPMASLFRCDSFSCRSEPGERAIEFLSIAESSDYATRMSPGERFQRTGTFLKIG
ncbi:uncharacterized protein LOC134839978 [Symsagittifera roscoffensis]|uniref:uncharacterized protein LOC134839978 n=1 Tax=Symsagittifera roscoffensis TaxID=84072 RepID=UPI00307B288D